MISIKSINTDLITYYVQKIEFSHNISREVQWRTIYLVNILVSNKNC